MKKRLLNIREAAEYLATTVGSLYQKIHKGTIPHVKIGRSVRFDIEELDEFIQENAVAVVSEELSGIRKKIKADLTLN